MLFRFKQFSVKQAVSAMKITTDGVLLGAWTSLYNPSHILDIGAGTGLLSLMLAQRSSAPHITAIEIDEAAYTECYYNFQHSPWAARLYAYHTSFQLFTAERNTFTNEPSHYDLIISNPPFYTAQYKAPAAARHTARSAEALPFEVLLKGVSELLSPTGHFSVIIPYAEEESFTVLASIYGLYPQQGLRTQGTLNSPIKRSLLLFGKQPTYFTSRNLIIEKSRHNYTDSYIALTKEFYLNF